MVKATILEDQDWDFLLSRIERKIEEVLDRRANKTSEKMQGEDLLTRNEVCTLLKIDLSTLYRWELKGKIKSYSIHNKKYYKRSEIMQALQPVNISSNE